MNSPQASSPASSMPTGKIGDLTIGRLMSGSNLISPNMHARDLLYMNALADHYNSEEKIFETMRLCEEYGINSINLKSHNFRRVRLARYWGELGGKMKWFADVIERDIERFEQKLVEHLELGADAAYLWGGSSDIWYYEGKRDHIIRAYEIMRKYHVPVGIGAHRLAPIKFCEEEGIKPDFYIKTLHHDRYWSAHPKKNRTYMEMFQPISGDTTEYHDNMFCHEADETIEFMQSVEVPWIAFKVLAAGAITPNEGFRYAFENGADFLCVGMFDFQVVEDAFLTQKAFGQAQNRKRPWFG